MKIKSLLTAVVMVAFAAATVSAQESTDNKKAGNRKECCQVEKCALEGLSLTADQQAALKKLNGERAEKMRKAVGDRQKQDSVKRAARKQEKLEYLHQVRAILTPEQYVTYLENQVVNAAPTKMHKKAKRGDKQRIKKGIRPGKHQPAGTRSEKSE